MAVRIIIRGEGNFPPVNAESLSLGYVAARAWREGAALAREWREYLKICGRPDGKHCRSLAGTLQGMGLLTWHQARKDDTAVVRFRYRRPPLVRTAPSTGTPDTEALMEQLARVLCAPRPSWRCRSAAEWQRERCRRRWWVAGFLSAWWGG